MRNVLTSNINSRTVSYILIVFFLTIFINTKTLFLHVGINLRPYYFVLIILVIYFIIKPAKVFRFYKLRVLYFFFLLILGILGWLFSPKEVEVSDFLSNVIFITLQFLTFTILIKAFYVCDKSVLFSGISRILPIVTVLPLLLYLVRFSSVMGMINETIIGVYTGHDGMPRLVGFFEDPNYFSLYLIPFLTFSFYLNRYIKGSFSKYDLLFLVVGLIDIVLSQSRSAIGVILFFLILNVAFQRSKTFIMGVVFLGVMALIGFSYIDTDILNIVSQRYENIEQDGSANERVFLMEEGLKAPLKSPFGVGVGNCPAYYYHIFHENKLAHNDWLTVLIECGVLGLFCYLMIWFITLRHADKLGRLSIICIMLMLSTLSAYGYDPIVPTALAFYTYFCKNRVIQWIKS